MEKILNLNKKDGKSISYDTCMFLRYICNEIDTMIKNGVVASPEKTFKENPIVIDRQLLLSILGKEDITKDEIYSLADNLRAEIKSACKANNLKVITPIGRMICIASKGEFIIRIDIDYLKDRLNNFKSYSVCKL